MVLVSTTGSPLEVADAISRVAGTRDRSTIRAEVPTWDAVVDRTLELYRQAAAAHAMPVPDRWLPPRPVEPLNGDPRVALERQR